MSQNSPHGRAEGNAREELIHNLLLSLVDWPVHSRGQYAPCIAHCVTLAPLDSYWEVVPLHVFDVCLSLPVHATGRASQFVWVVAAAGTWLHDLGSLQPEGKWADLW